MRHEDNLHNRIRLDRRRFEAAHLRYAILQVTSRYPLIVPGPIGIITDVADVLRQVTPAYYEAFTQRYAGMHMHCTLLNTKSHLVFPITYSTQLFLSWVQEYPCLGWKHEE